MKNELINQWVNLTGMISNILSFQSRRLLGTYIIDVQQTESKECNLRQWNRIFIEGYLEVADIDM